MSAQLKEFYSRRCLAATFRTVRKSRFNALEDPQSDEYGSRRDLVVDLGFQYQLEIPRSAMIRLRLMQSLYQCPYRIL